MDDCIFCKIVSGEAPCKKIWEDDYFLGFHDASPVEEGHSLLIPKEHFAKLVDVDGEYAQRYLGAIQEFGKILMKEYGADGFNVQLNNGEAAGQVVFHTHFHFFAQKEWRWKNRNLYWLVSTFLAFWCVDFV